ncbi:MAG: sugar ABC transporter permease [Rhodospirillaceae bacterium]|nr:sugar ABC transporter permease [Rhodospirillaceae bacterium]
MMLFTLYPVAYALYTSLHQVIVIFPVEPFVGLRNYREVVTSPYFRQALVNTLSFALVSTPLILIVGYGVARLLLARFIGRAVVRSVVILPWVLPGAISAVVWQWILHPSWGILNLLLYKAGIIDKYIPWLTDPDLARLSVVLAFVWTQFPLVAILFMAALTVIDPELYEAALIDGARAWQRFRYVTFPHLRPVTVVLAIYQSLVALTSYDLVYAMTAGGPGTATTLLSFQIWKETFTMMNFGTGSAVGFILVVLSLVFVLAIVKALPTALVERRA